MSGHTLISNTDEKKSGIFYIDLMTLYVSMNCSSTNINIALAIKRF
jgi:hypothetical protein